MVSTRLAKPSPFGRLICLAAGAAAVAACANYPGLRANQEQNQGLGGLPQLTHAQTPSHTRELPAAGDPYQLVPCPTDMTFQAGPRKIDVREPYDTVAGPYAREHMQLASPAEVFTKQAAIERVLEIENKTPGLVPAGFRAEMKIKERDPSFRLFMARCELETPETTRRAAYDAALAFLLGAPQAAVLPLTERAFFPDGTASNPCSKDSDCKASKCDKKERACRSDKAMASRSLSKGELDIEDTLSRTFVALLTPEDIRRTQHHPSDYIGMWAYGSMHRCGTALCKFARYPQLAGGLAIVHWDIRYRGGQSSAPVALTDHEQRCKAATGHINIDRCRYDCQTGRKSEEPTCLARCAASCR